ncbi:hypothetical protein Ddc_15879 [Ditylenchus destructor]|nr:hypothetical protein Ddc_15879 [Ditylenchus destructor]
MSQAIDWVALFGGGGILLVCAAGCYLTIWKCIDWGREDGFTVSCSCCCERALYWAAQSGHASPEQHTAAIETTNRLVRESVNTVDTAHKCDFSLYIYIYIYDPPIAGLKAESVLHW